MKELRDAASDFKEADAQHRQARLILEDGCEIPPSLEVFERELKVRREGIAEADWTIPGVLTPETWLRGRTETQPTSPGLSVEGCARRIAQGYQRVEGFFGDDG